MNNQVTQSISGSCLCSAVSFTIGGTLGEMNHCHCSMCRKYHGSAFATYLQAGELQWLSGESQISTYESSPGTSRSFCSCCGSVLPMRAIDNVGYDVPAGLLDDDPVARPAKHIFVESSAPWFSIDDSLPQQRGYGDNSSLPEIDRPDRTGFAGNGYCGGSCACARISFRYQMSEDDYLMYCHCSRCRKVKGAAHAANVFVKPEHFEWISGEAMVINYDHAEAIRFGNSFCRQCGSSVPRQAETSPLMNIPAGSLDDHPQLITRGHIYVDSKAPWFEVPENAVQFPTIPGK